MKNFEIYATYQPFLFSAFFLRLVCWNGLIDMFAQSGSAFSCVNSNCLYSSGCNFAMNEGSRMSSITLFLALHNTLNLAGSKSASHAWLERICSPRQVGSIGPKRRRYVLFYSCGQMLRGLSHIPAITPALEQVNSIRQLMGGKRIFYAGFKHQPLSENNLGFACVVGGLDHLSDPFLDL